MGRAKPSKAGRVTVKMVSTEGTGEFYMTEKNQRNCPDKMKLKKYSRKLKRVITFKEEKAR